jgi:hypothetical protein
MLRRALPLCVLLPALLAAGCGSDEGEKGAGFPGAEGRSLQEVLVDTGAEPSEAHVLAPTVSVLRPGTNRFGFGLFTVNREDVEGVDSVALYVTAGRDASGVARGPYPARIESLAVESEHESKTTRDDPDAAKVVYVARVKLPETGPYAVAALLRRGESLEPTGPSGIQVKKSGGAPRPGDRVPRISTPTAKSVGGDLSKIDTRDPPDDMHEVDFARVLGRKPIVLVFATPRLCESRVCGPVVDVAEQVKARYGREVAFIHMEIYRDNDPNKGFRPQVGAFGLRTEPWAFLIDRRGRVFRALEGAYSVRELTAGVQQLVKRS